MTPARGSTFLTGLLFLLAASSGCSGPTSPTAGTAGGSLTVAPAESVIDVVIDVSPNVLDLGSQGQVVTVHTDLAYGAVDPATVRLNGVEISSWKADDRGEFVAKFLMSDIKDLPLRIGDYNRLVLEGSTFSRQAFLGSQDILVVDNTPRS